MFVLTQTDNFLASIYTSADNFLLRFSVPVYTLSPRNYRISLPFHIFYQIRSQQSTDISLLFIIPPTECACLVLSVNSDIFSLLSPQKT